LNEKLNTTSKHPDIGALSDARADEFRRIAERDAMAAAVSAQLMELLYFARVSPLSTRCGRGRLVRDDSGLYLA